MTHPHPMPLEAIEQLTTLLSAARATRSGTHDWEGRWSAFYAAADMVALLRYGLATGDMVASLVEGCNLDDVEGIRAKVDDLP